VAEAISSAFGGWKRRLDAAASGGPPVSYAKLIEDHLNEAHRNNLGTGCAFGALAGEIARSDKRTGALASEQVRNDLQLIAGLLPGKTSMRQGQKANPTFSTLVGAMSLARAVSDEALSRENIEHHQRSSEEALDRSSLVAKRLATVWSTDGVPRLKPGLR
jgi:TetR/AcrR family transcriptional repressor of nem operon